MADVLAEKMAKGKELKDKGNASFKAGDIKNALKGYHEATLYLIGLDSSSVQGFVPSAAQVGEDQKREIANAHFRRAQARFQLGELEKADADAKKACQLEPKDASARELLQTIRQRNKELTEKARKEWAGNFQKNTSKTGAENSSSDGQ
ncbi:hypothetical protein HK104_010049 [Borealophlyctis nickersoniae]|nr:hypothetical protein HK104_010049 [Borealophlyctis nickersoniae]